MGDQLTVERVAHPRQGLHSMLTMTVCPDIITARGPKLASWAVVR